ncbi:MAG: hypothetical protein RI883_331 [Bacteroidota bacterium]|jgi:hypothetical protein
MKTSKLIIVAFSFIYFNCFSQTKMISHKSHSGSKSTFSVSLKKSLFNIGESNFGMAPERFVRNSNLDTVKLLSPHVAVMITSETCFREDYSRTRGSMELWSAGADTVYYHDVFNSKNSVAQIKSTLKNNYYFNNSVDSIVFIGFDGKYATIEVKNQPIVEENTNTSEKSSNTKEYKKPSLFMMVIFAILTKFFKTPF